MAIFLYSEAKVQNTSQGPNQSVALHRSASGYSPPLYTQQDPRQYQHDAGSLINV
jgi:hypothetical protein